MSSFGDDHGYVIDGYDHRFPSQRFYSSFSQSAGDSPPMFSSYSTGGGADDVFSSVPVSESPPSVFSVSGGGFSSEQNGQGGSNGPMLPLPDGMQAEEEEGFALREWRRQNAIRLKEKEKKENQMLHKIIQEADDFKTEFYRKRHLTIENKKASNGEKEKLFLANREMFHAEAEKNYWKAIAELIPQEVPAIEKRGKKQQDQEKKKPSIVVIQGPKPGKPTDLSRMRQLLLKLKHNPPLHMKPKPSPSAEPKKGGKVAPSAANHASTKTAPTTSATPETVIVT
ncbi:clathrin light chain 2 [Ricinus communis]|uniref:Clathrin light chain n=1 Tax=Ricinus communis TaxID=3988 RepID=B9SQ44_RICCO|nr:clathrin light chain 2 [Ricinus communis]EEF34292.1 conserved hypothetical protein [Ricinus communis]|eukprot:XP_002528113.1 clathrin light chain 2 [Ricinus communis]